MFDGFTAAIFINAKFALFLIPRHTPKIEEKDFNMKTKKKIFLIVSIIFLIIILLIGMDISSRTTFPGSKGNLKERIMEGEAQPKTDNRNGH
ncbi:hypothetical protein GCM10028791_31480 [Echinicola sediminis]